MYPPEFFLRAFGTMNLNGAFLVVRVVEWQADVHCAYFVSRSLKKLVLPRTTIALYGGASAR